MTDALEIGVRIDIGASDAGLASVQAVFQEEFNAAARDIGAHVQEEVQSGILNMADEALVDTGHLLNSITFAAELIGTLVQVIVGTNVPYAKYQEYGTRPHWVPFHLAPSLYKELRRKWGWEYPTEEEAAGLDPGRLWLKKTKDSRPMWGCFVSGEAQPFLWPGWERSVAFIEARLTLAGQRVAQRINTMGG